MSGDISQGKDQRDHFYFIAMGHYKLEVKITMYIHVFVYTHNLRLKDMLGQGFLSFIERCPLFGVSFIGGSTVVCTHVEVTKR